MLTSKVLQGPFSSKSSFWPLSPTPVPLGTKLTSVLCHCHWIQLYTVWFVRVCFGESLLHMNKDPLFLAYGSLALSSQSDAACLLDFYSVLHSFMLALVPLAAVMSHPSPVPPIHFSSFIHNTALVHLLIQINGQSQTEASFFKLTMGKPTGFNTGPRFLPRLLSFIHNILSQLRGVSTDSCLKFL